MRRLVVARYFLYAVTGMLLVIVTIASTVDFGRFKRGAEALVSDLLDRDVTIAGPFHLTLGRTIHLSAEDFRLASSEWSVNPELASISRIDARVDMWSLLSQTIVLESLIIEGARINLERSAEQGDNWTLFEPEGGSSDEDSSSPPSRLPVRFGDVRINDAILDYSASDLSRQFRLTVRDLTAAIDDNGRIGMTLEGDINETPLDLEISALFEDLIEFSGGEFEVSGNLGEIALEGAATIADLLHPSRPTAQLNLTGPNVEYLTDILRIDRLTSGPLDLSLVISPVVERMQLNMSGEVGEFALLVNGQFVDLRQLENMELQVSSSGPSARTVADILGWSNVPDEPFSIIGAVQRTGSALSLETIRITVGETQFDISGQFDDFPSANGANATVRVDGPDFGRFNRLLGLPGRLDGPFELEADLVSLETGGANVDLTASAQDITLAARGSISDAPDFSGSDLEIEFTGPKLNVITEAAGLELGPDEPFAGSLTARRVADGAIIEGGTAIIGDARFTFAGRIGEELPLSWNFDFEASTPNMKARLAEFGIQYEPLPEGDLQAAGSMRSGGGSVLLEDVTLSVANTVVELNGSVGAPPTLEGTNLGVRASGEALSQWLPARDEFSALDKPFALEGDMRLAGGTLELSAVELQMDEARLTAEIELAVEPMLDHGSFSLEATTPDLFALWPRLADIAVQQEAPLELRTTGDWADNLWNLSELDMRLADGSLQAGGTVDGPPNFDRTDLTLDWTIGSISNLGVLLRHELPDEPAHLRFQLTGTMDEMAIDDFEGAFGDSDIYGELSLRGGEIPTIAIDLTSNRLDLTPYLPPEPEAPSQQASDTETTDGRLIPDYPIRIDMLGRFLANVSVRANEIKARERTLQAVALRASVADGALTVDEFELQGARGGQLTGLLELRPSDVGAELQMRILGDGLSLGLPAYSAEELEGLPRYDVDLAFITVGNTVREMAGNVDGYLKMVGGDGRMRFGAMRMFTQDFLAQLLDTLNPFSARDPYTNVECAVVLAAVEDGTLVGSPVFVAQSDRLKVFANAEVDLKTERVNADFNTTPQRGLGISLSSLVTPYVKVAGTLANPTLGVNPVSATIEGGAAVATGGVSILARSFRDRFLSSRDPCGTAISNAAEQFRSLEQEYGGSESVPAP